MDLSAVCNNNGTGGLQRPASQRPAPTFTPDYSPFNVPSTPLVSNRRGDHDFQTPSSAGSFITGTPGEALSYRGANYSGSRTPMPSSGPMVDLACPPTLYLTDRAFGPAAPNSDTRHLQPDANYVHELVTLFRLTEVQQTELAKLNRESHGAPQWFLKLHLYSIANTFAAKNEGRELAAKIETIVETVKGLNEKEVLKSFRLDSSASTTIRDYARNLISDPARCSFKTFGDDVVKALENEEVTKDLGVPSMVALSQAQKKDYTKSIKNITTDLTRQYKSDIKDMILGSGENRMVDSLKAAMLKHKLKWRTIKKLRMDDATEMAGLAIRRHLIRKFGDDREFVNKSDKWFESKNKEFGEKMNGDPWKQYIKKLIKDDEDRWPSAEDTQETGGPVNNELGALETAGGAAGRLPLAPYNP